MPSLGFFRTFDGHNFRMSASPECPVVEPAKVVIKPRMALPFFSRHPWVFPKPIAKIAGDPQPGDEVELVTQDGQFIARGLFNPHSMIRVRLYSWQAEQPLDEAFWASRLADAISLRKRLYGEFTPENACRLVASEGDQLSGLTVDRYGEFLLVQITSRALAERKDLLIRELVSQVSPRGIWLRTEKGMREAEQLELADGLLWGEAPPRPFFLEENGVRFGVDVSEGQKTGFFLDQRENRLTVRNLAAGRRVLDVCCYSGGFALNAAIGGASNVLGVDVSESALELAASNALLNGVGERTRWRKGDAFKTLEALQAEGEKFDLVVLDPPKLTRHRAGLDAALRGYFSLNRLALEVLNPGGILVTCSCSGLVTHEMFSDVLSKVAQQANRHIEILEARGPAADHPRSVHCEEGNYLKCYVCRVV